jgi:hypothetical protein
MLDKKENAGGASGFYLPLSLFERTHDEIISRRMGRRLRITCSKCRDAVASK